MAEQSRADCLAGRVAVIGAVLSGAGAVFVGVMWFLGYKSVATFGLSYGRVAPGSALLMAILSLAVLARGWSPRSRFARVTVWLAAGITLCLTTSTFVNFFHPASAWGWGQWLGSESLKEIERRLGSMVVCAAILFVSIAGASVLAMTSFGTRGVLRRLESLIAGLALALCVLVILGYAADADRLFKPPWNLPAAPTAILCLPMSMSLLALARPRGWLLRLASGEVGDAPTRRFSWTLAAVASVLAVGLLASGALYLKQTIATGVMMVGRDLSAVADLQVQRIARWRVRVHNQANAVRESPALRRDVAAFVQPPAAPPAATQVAQWLTLLNAEGRYSEMALFDRSGGPMQQRLSIPEGAQLLDQALLAKLNSAVDTNAVLFGDLELDPKTQRPRLDVLLPVWPLHETSAIAPTNALAIILLRLDPARELFGELLTNWPAASQTAETLLVRQEAGHVVYLSPLRHGTNLPLTLKLPLSKANANLEAALAIRESAGEMQCRDYRAVPVRAAFRPVPASDVQWHLVAKEDQEEIYASLRTRAMALAGTLGTLVLVLGLAVRLLWQQRRAETINQELAARRERDALSERLAHVMDNLDDVIMISDAQRRVVDVNRRAEVLYGYSQAELRGMDLSLLRAPEARVEFASTRSTLEEQDHALFQTLHRRKDGSIFPVEINSRGVEMGGQHFFLGIIRDITERRRAEEALRLSEERLRFALEGATDGLWDWNLETGVFYLSPRYAEMLGYDLAELPADRDHWRKMVHPDDLPRVERAFEDYFAGQLPVYHCEYRMRAKHGDWLWMLSRGKTVARDANGKPVRMVGTQSDITNRHRAEAALVASERGYREIFNATTEAILIHDAESGELLDVNESMLRMYGYTTKDEVIGRSSATFTTEGLPYLPVGTPRRLSSAPQGGERVVEWQARRKNGERFWVEVSLRRVRLGGQERVLAVMRDVSQRKRTEAERERLLAILERTPDFVGIADLQGRALYVNGTTRRLMGFTADEESRGRLITSFHPARDAERLLNEALPAAQRDGVWIGETALLASTGAELPVSQVIMAHKDKQGQVTHYSTIMRDLSEQKRIQQLIRINEERLRTIIEHSTQLFYAHTPEHVLTYVSPQSREFFDCEPEEAKVRWTEFLTDHPANRRGLELTETAIRSGQRQPPYELELVTRKGRRLWVEVRESPVVLKEQTVGIVGSLTDITARKRSEQIAGHLARLGRELGAATTSTQAAQAVADTAQELLGWDACFLIVRSQDLQRTGFMLGMDTINGQRVPVPPTTGDEVTAIERRVMEQGGQLILREPRSSDRFVPFGDADRPSASLLYVPVQHQGRYLGTFSIQSYTHHAYTPASLDLLQTLADHVAGALERIRAEQSLRESEDRYRQLFEAESDAIVLIENETGRILEANSAAATLYGYSRDALLAKRNTDLSAEPEQTRQVTAETPVAADRVVAIPLRMHRKRDGTVFPVEITGRFFTWHGRAVHLAAIRDITERKRSEEALRDSEARYRLIAENTADVIWMYDLSLNRFTFVSPSVERLRGYPVEEVTRQNLEQVLTPEAYQVIAGRLQQRLERLAVGDASARTMTNQLPVTRKDGPPVETETVTTLVTDEQGNVTHILGVTRDITERKRAEEALHESQRFLTKAQEVARLGCYNLHVTTGLWTATPMLQTIFGLTPDFPQTVEGWLQLVHPDDRAEMQRYFMVHVLQSCQRFEKEYRIRRVADGETRWVSGFGELELDVAGHPVRMIGTIQDITARKQVEEALRDSERNYREIFNASSDAIFIHDAATGAVLDVNEPMLRMFGVTREEARTSGPDDTSLGESPYSAVEARQWLEKAATEGPQVFEWRARKKDGALFWVEVALKCSVLGGARRVLAVVRDITARKQAEDALRETERRLSTLIANLPAGFAYRCRNDRDWTMEFVTAGIRTWLGIAPEELTSGKMRYSDLVHPEDQQRIWAEVQAALTGRRPFQLEYRLKLGPDDIRWVWEQGGGVFNDRGDATALEGLITDITARKLAEAALRELSGRLLAAQDEERRRIARDLHDTTAQTVAALCMNLTMLETRLPASDAPAHRALADAVALGERAGQEIRTMSYLLHPPILEHVGLAGAIREFAAGFSRRSGIRVTVEVAPAVGRFAPDVELALLRIVQESLGNVHRHSGSLTAAIRLQVSGDRIVLDVADAGIGFKPLALEDGSEGQFGVGIAGMRERLRHLGGHLEINSDAGGTTVRATLPFLSGSAAESN